MQSAQRAKASLNGADIYSGCCTLKIEYAKVSVTENMDRYLMSCTCQYVGLNAEHVHNYIAELWKS